ncbi:MFS transporter [Saccharothrix variisporea]|uniref:Putative MFS family arabinose efflux permease n=1 Tax=Saccharothrix variisporea TaxID=543527 RepID=A0A495XCS5_9PSEU|nr:MFS transporter [Saccharothrix variisporea]RKT70403.1 putative MFS family arabinose efflux permease [Saccharothrix variisporea]
MTTNVQVKTRWTPVVTLALAMLVVTTEMTVAAVALPSLGAELGVGPGATAWVLLGYTLPMAAIAIPAGRWVDRIDVRLAFLLALAGIGVASAVTAFAPVFWVLLAGRVLQGVAAALVLAAYMPIVVAAVEPAARGRAIGYVITIMTVGGLAGAPLGGVMAGALGWRSVFLMKLPVLVVALWLGIRSLRGDGRGLVGPDRGLWLEVLLLGGAITALLLAFEDMVWLVAVAVVLAVLWGRLPSSRPVLGLVRRRVFALPLLTLTLVTMSGGLLFLLVPYFVTDVLGGSPEDVGVVLLVFVAGVGVLSAVAGSLADRYGAWLVALAGVVVTVVGLLLLLPPVTGLVDLSWRLAVMGVGQGLFNAAINALLMSLAPEGMAGAAGGVSATARMIGSTVGPAVAALVVAADSAGGFRTGVVVLTVVVVLGGVALLGGRSR